MDLAEVIERAATLIKDQGLARRAMSYPSGEHCTLGALREVTDDRLTYSLAAVAVAERIRSTGFVRRSPPGAVYAPSSTEEAKIIAAWNDNVATQQVVVDLLEGLAKDLHNEA